MKHSQSLGNSLKLNTRSASSRPITPGTPKIRGTPSATPINMQKREKLKNLLVEKFMKKFACNDYNLVEKEVSTFIQKEKLTEIELKQFEERLKKKLHQKNESEILKNNFEQQTETRNNEEGNNADEPYMNNYMSGSKNPSQINDDARSIHSNMTNMSDLSKKFSKNPTQLKYEEITNFELRKLLQNEKKPVIRKDFDNYGDEWTAIAKYKNSLWDETKKENKILDKQTKNKTRMAFDSQIQEKQQLKLLEKKMEDNHHKDVLTSVDKLTQEEMRKLSEMKKKKLIEKEMRDIQIIENIGKKKSEFQKNREYDNTLIAKVLNENEKEKQKEIERKIEAKQELRRMLDDNEELKRRQMEENRKEREQDIKFMEEYTKILDKQEQDRADYFKKCENRQKEAMSRMAETVIKEKDMKAKADEEKMTQYQKEKDRRDQEEENRRKRHIKDSKLHMREYLTNQMVEKKKMGEYEKKLESHQLSIWNKENEDYFRKEKETNERVKQLNMLYADFLKSQMGNKNSKLQKMNEEEYRLNRDILEEIANQTPNTSKRNFLI